MEQIGNQKGIGLIEVLVSMILLAFGVLGLAMMVLTSIQGNSASRENTIAANLIKQQIELYESMDTLPAAPYELQESGLRDMFARSTYMMDHASDSTVPEGACRIQVAVSWTDQQEVERNRSFSTYLLK